MSQESDSSSGMRERSFSVSDDGNYIDISDTETSGRGESTNASTSSSVTDGPDEHGPTKKKRKSTSNVYQHFTLNEAMGKFKCHYCK